MYAIRPISIKLNKFRSELASPNSPVVLQHDGANDGEGNGLCDDLANRLERRIQYPLLSGM